MTRLPTRIRNETDEIVRARCLRFLDNMLRGVSFTHLVGNNCPKSLNFELDDLSTEALERIALDEVGRFWSGKRFTREWRERDAARRAA